MPVLRLLLRLLHLWFPVVCPSWRFFNSIGPSPRLEYAIGPAPYQWQAFRPRPATLTLGQSLWQLLHNPQWNETLYLNTCCEHLLENPNTHWHLPIQQRLQRACQLGEIQLPENTQQMRFRVAYYRRHQQQIQVEIGYTSPAFNGTPQG